MGPCPEEPALLRELASLSCSGATRQSLRGAFRSLPDGPPPPSLLPVRSELGPRDKRQPGEKSMADAAQPQDGAGSGAGCGVQCSNQAGWFWNPWCELAPGLCWEAGPGLGRAVDWLRGASWAQSGSEVMALR